MTQSHVFQLQAHPEICCHFTSYLAPSKQGQEADGQLCLNTPSPSLSLCPVYKFFLPTGFGNHKSRGLLSGVMGDFDDRFLHFSPQHLKRIYLSVQILLEWLSDRNQG